MLLIVCILGCILLLSFEFHFFKDLKTPTFMYGFVWLVVYLSLIPQESDSIQHHPLLPSFFIASLLFFLGFFITNSRNSYSPMQNSIQYELVWYPLTKKIVFFIEYILSIAIFISCYNVISISQFSAWQAVRHGMAEENIFPTWVYIAINPVRIIFFVSCALYLYTPNKENRIALLLATPPIILTGLFTARGDWFFIIITLVYMALYIKSFSNKKIISIGVFSFVMFMVIFIISSLDKYKTSYVYMNDLEKMQWIFSGYFISPISNFFDWFHNHPDYAYGKYTFRFFFALLSPLFPDIEVVKTLLEFRYTSSGTHSNVYTSLNWLVRDFGIWWAFLVQFLLGFFYGYLYKRYKQNDAVHLITLITLCMLMTPIANNFFDDILFSNMSNWVQRCIFLYVLVKTSVIIRKRPI